MPEMLVDGAVIPAGPKWAARLLQDDKTDPIVCEKNPKKHYGVGFVMACSEVFRDT